MNKLLPVIFILVIFNSCKSVRSIIPSSETRKLEKILELAEQNEPVYHTFKAKAKIRVKTQDFDQNATLYLNVIHDSLIWGSVTYLFGFEVLRFFITPDSMVMIDKFRQQYSIYPFGKILKVLAFPELSFSSFEKLLTGSLIFPVNRQYQAESSQSGFVLVKNDNFSRVNIWLNYTGPVLSGYDVIVPSNSSRSQVRYSGTIKYEKQSIPRYVDIKVFLPEENILTLNYQTISFDKKITVNTSIPNGFKKIE